jgi:hypothetical protein
MTDLIVAFLQQRNHPVVRFADAPQLYIVERHEVARHELWYTTAEYYLMQLAIEQDVPYVRTQLLAGVPFNTILADESSVCCVGIEHLLTPACIDEKKACRALCIRAVLTEQVTQGPAARFGWGAIANASYDQSLKAVLRARRLGKLQQELSASRKGRVY